MKTTLDYVIRVALPSSAAFHSGPSGDSDYDQAYKEALFSAVPVGFEPAWQSRDTWPRDKDGMTWVRLYLTDNGRALESQAAEVRLLQTRLKKITAHAESITRLAAR